MKTRNNGPKIIGRSARRNFDKPEFKGGRGDRCHLRSSLDPENLFAVAKNGTVRSSSVKNVYIDFDNGEQGNFQRKYVWPGEAPREMVIE